MLTGFSLYLSIYLFILHVFKPIKKEKQNISSRSSSSTQKNIYELHSATSQAKPKSRTTIYSLQSKLMITMKNGRKKNISLKEQPSDIWTKIRSSNVFSLRLRVFFLLFLLFLHFTSLNFKISLFWLNFVYFLYTFLAILPNILFLLSAAYAIYWIETPYTFGHGFRLQHTDF